MKAKKKPALIGKVSSLSDLRAKAESDPRYLALALAGAENLGGSVKTLAEAMAWLLTNAQETDEAGVVAEVNFCRDLVESEVNRG